MTVYKKENGKWYMRSSFHGQDIHRLCRGATTKLEAQKIEQAFIYDLELQEHGYKPKNRKNIYFKRLIELYTTHAKNNHKKFKNQEYYLKAIEEYFGNNKPANDIKAKDIETYKTYLKNAKKLKNSSINRFLEILSKMFNLAIDNEELIENPVSKAGKLKEDNLSIRFLTTEEEVQLFNAIDKVSPQINPIVIMALQTGMRKGEILNLQWINIRNGYIELLDTKSGKPRNIPISETLENVLNNLPQDTEYVFPNPLTGKPYSDIKKAWNKALDKAEIKNFRFHDLRHTVATRMVEKGIELLVVKDILGHSMIETTMRYAHPVPARKQAAIDILNNYNKKKVG